LEKNRDKLIDERCSAYLKAQDDAISKRKAADEDAEKVFENAQKAVSELNLPAEVFKVEDIQEIVNAGVMMTPALAVDGEIKSVGKVLTSDDIKKILSQ
jgi:small redox-active disulfide protein 2